MNIDLQVKICIDLAGALSRTLIAHVWSDALGIAAALTTAGKRVVADLTTVTSTASHFRLTPWIGDTRHILVLQTSYL